MSDAANRKKDRKSNLVSMQRIKDMRPANEVAKKEPSIEIPANRGDFFGSYSDDSHESLAVDDNVDLSSEDKGYKFVLKSTKPLYSPSSLGTVRLPSAAELGYDMQFGTILSDTSDSGTENTWESNNCFRPEMIGRYDTKSGSDIPSDEEEDVDEKEIETNQKMLVSRMKVLQMLPKNIGTMRPKNVGTTRNQDSSSGRKEGASQPIDDSDPSTYSDNAEAQSDLNVGSIGQREFKGINGVMSKGSKTKKRKSINKQHVKTVTMENSAPASLSERAPGLYSNLQTYISSRNTTSKEHSSANIDFESITHALKKASPQAGSELRERVDDENNSKSHSDDVVDASMLEYFIGDLRVGDILEIALQYVLHEHCIRPTDAGNVNLSGDRPGLFTEQILVEFCMSVAYHIGLDGSPAAMVSASLRLELKAFELCPITSQNCALLFEMTKVVVMRIDRDMNLGLGVLKPINKGNKGNEENDAEHGQIYSLAELDQNTIDNKNENYERVKKSGVGGGTERNNATIINIEDDSSSDEEDEIEGNYVKQLARSKLNDAPAWLLPMSPLDSTFRKSIGGVGQREFGEVARDRSPSPLGLTPAAQHRRAVLAAEVENILRGVDYNDDDEDMPLLTIDDLPDNYTGHSGNHPVFFDRREEDQERFNSIAVSSATWYSSTSFSPIGTDSAIVNQRSKDNDDCDNMAYDDNEVRNSMEMGSESTGRRQGRAVSFDSSVSSEIEDDEEHEQLYSPRFNPPLSPPPHHLHLNELSSDEEEEQLEELSNGHSTSISPLESTRTIVIRTPELWRESPLQVPTEIERYQTRLRLRAQVERELLRRGNHVAFESEQFSPVREEERGIDHEEHTELGSGEVKFKDEEIEYTDGEYGIHGQQSPQDELCEGDEEELHGESSHIHPSSHPAHGPPPVRNERPTILPNNLELSEQITESLKNVVEMYKSDKKSSPKKPSSKISSPKIPLPKTKKVVSMSERTTSQPSIEFGLGLDTDQGGKSKAYVRPALARSASLDDLDWRGQGECVRTRVLRSYEALSSRTSGNDTETDEESQVGFRGSIYSQYDRFTNQGSPDTLTSPPSSNLPLPRKGSPLRHKGLHVHISEEAAQEIPSSSTSSSIGHAVTRSGHEIFYDDIDDYVHKKKKKSKNNREKTKKKKRNSIVEVEEGESRPLYAPKYFTEKFIDLRKSQDFRTGIYRSSSTSIPPSPLSPNSARSKSTPLSSVNPFPSKSNTHASTTAAPAAVAKYRRVSPPKQSQSSVPSVSHIKARNSLNPNFPPDADVRSKVSVMYPRQGQYRDRDRDRDTESEREKEKEKEKEKERSSATRSSLAAPSSRSTSMPMSLPLPLPASSSDLDRRRLSVHIPTAASSSSSFFSPDNEDYRGSAEVKHSSMSMSKTRSPTARSPTSILRRSCEPDYNPYLHRMSSEKKSPRSSTVRTLQSSPYNTFSIPRSISPTLRTNMRSSIEMDIGQDFDVEVEEGRGGDDDYVDYKGVLNSSQKDGKNRPKSAKGRRRVSDGSGSVTSASSCEPSGTGTMGDFSPGGLDFSTSKLLIESQLQRDLNRMREKQRQIGSDFTDPTASRSSLLFSRDAAFSQSLREAISQSVEDSLRQLLGPSFRNILLGNGDGILSPSSVPSSVPILKNKKKKKKRISITTTTSTSNPSVPNVPTNRSDPSSASTRYQQNTQNTHVIRSSSKSSTVSPLHGRAGDLKQPMERGDVRSQRHSLSSTDQHGRTSVSENVRTSSSVTDVRRPSSASASASTGNNRQIANEGKRSTAKVVVGKSVSPASLVGRSRPKSPLAGSGRSKSPLPVSEKTIVEPKHRRKFKKRSSM